MMLSILIVAVGLLINLMAALDAGFRYRRNKMSGVANGSLVYFRSHAISKITLFCGQIILMRILFVLPTENLEVEILRAVLSLSMSVTAWINMASFRRLRNSHVDPVE